MPQERQDQAPQAQPDKRDRSAEPVRPGPLVSERLEPRAIRVLKEQRAQLARREITVRLVRLEMAEVPVLLAKMVPPAKQVQLDLPDRKERLVQLAQKVRLEPLVKLDLLVQLVPLVKVVPLVPLASAGALELLVRPEPQVLKELPVKLETVVLLEKLEKLVRKVQQDRLDLLEILVPLVQQARLVRLEV